MEALGHELDFTREGLSSKVAKATQIYEWLRLIAQSGHMTNQGWQVSVVSVSTRDAALGRET